MNQALTEQQRVAMKPIIFSTPMIRAILENRKFQTRRMVKPQPIDNREIDGNFFEGKHKGYVKMDGHPNWQKQFAYEFCPYGKVGDILYVRETGVRYHTINHIRKPSGASFSEISDGLYAYKADGFETLEELRTHIRLMSDASFEGVEFDGNRWHPSIHMPRWAARIFLKITDISVERLQDITEEDAMHEGVEKSFAYEYDTPDGLGSASTYRAGFKRLWGIINGEDSWKQNPWIWKLTFERIEKPEKYLQHIETLKQKEG